MLLKTSSSTHTLIVSKVSEALKLWYHKGFEIHYLKLAGLSRRELYDYDQQQKSLKDKKYNLSLFLISLISTILKK